jgi:pyruvate,water dikinase
MKYLYWLGEPGADDPAAVGGKAANLSRLAAAYRVPPGFCLSAAAHARRIAGAAGAAAIPEDVAAAAAAAYAELGARRGAADPGAAAPVVAVRSSALDEDSASASFAGIYTTLLNVRGEGAVLGAIASCWASAEDPRVAAYRRGKGLPDAGVGVLVQELVAADLSAVVFSNNPTNGAADEIVINANLGLGESIVGGTATPDTWIVQRPDLETRRFDLGAKDQMTILADEGTREVPVLRTLRGRPCLADAQVRELAELALRLEADMGWPVDIECAYQGEQLYLLQCRPITATRH